MSDELPFKQGGYLFHFEPTPDITVYELAKIVAMGDIRLNQEAMKQLPKPAHGILPFGHPKDIRRHFKEE